ncbi:S-layer homology domain-containing protein [Paenibacillus sp. KS-LC4]|uniref:S-layer homology domain-containing protein n=1 Tax=Paenibacillus sp. KS-LC4 TaxID=2979727 RepID=UPI0030D1D0D4
MPIIRRTFICLLLISTMTGGITAYADSYKPNGHWADMLLQWASHVKIMEGYSDGSFQPDRLISEAEFLVVLYRAFDVRLDNNPISTAYQLAKSWNHPIVGYSKPALRSVPITQGQAAAIIAAARGVHYEGHNNIIYLLGNGMGSSPDAALSTFQSDAALTRAEAIQWIRQLTVAGMLDIKERPKALSDLSKLPDPATAPKALPLFSTQPVVRADFDLIGNNPAMGVKLWESKQAIDSRFGESQQAGMFKRNQYSTFTVHYNKAGQVDSWDIASDKDHLEASKLFSTYKGIVLEKSTITDVLQQYGTAGYLNSGSAFYFYEEAEDGSYTPLPPAFSRSQALNEKKTYVIYFSFNTETSKVDFIMVSWLANAFGNSSPD